MADSLAKLDEDLQTARRRRDDALKNYAVYYLKVVPGSTEGTARDMSPDHAKMEIARARDLHVDASVALLSAAVRGGQAQIGGLEAQVAQLKRTLVGLVAAAVLSSVATLVVVLLR